MIHSIVTECITLARPTFKISPNRLKELRDAENLTQLELARRVHARIGKNTKSSDATLVSDYQRIERTGRTSRKTAAALAEVLGTTAEILVGDRPPEAPEDFIDQVKRQLVSQLESSMNQALKQRYEQAVEAGDDLDYVARGIAARIEAAQIGSAKDTLIELSELTGWSLEQLQKQAYVHGYWFLQTAVHGRSTTQVVLGAKEIRWQVSETIAKWERSDSPSWAIRLTKSLPWYHIEFQHPNRPLLTYRFNFVRCQPNTEGLKWRNPTWTDQYWLEEPLNDWAFSAANFVTDFDGETWPRDIRNLRLLVIAADTRKTIQKKFAYIAIDLDEHLEDVLQRHTQTGEAHHFMSSWLLNELWGGIAPHLMACSLNDWAVSSSEGSVQVALSYRAPYELMKRRLATPGFLPDRFGIALVEETAEHSYRRAPWSGSSIKGFEDELMKRMARGCEHVEMERALSFKELPESTETRPE